MSKSMLCGLALAAVFAAGAVEVDGIAARVDAAAILRSDVYNEMRRQGGEPTQARYVEVRNDLIERKLILKAAANSKMTMQEWVIENRIREIVKRAFDGDRNRLMDSLAQQKLPYPEWREKMKEDMVVTAMRWQMVDKYAVASPAAMRQEFADHPERYAEGLKETVSVILLKPEDAAKKDEAAAAAKEGFADTARKYSSDSHAADGGVWKDVDPNEVFRAEVCEALAKLKVGETSGWIELDGWNFLLRKDAEKASRKLTFAEAAASIEENVKEDQARKLYAAWIERLKRESYVRVYDN